MWRMYSIHDKEVQQGQRKRYNGCMIGEKWVETRWQQVSHRLLLTTSVYQHRCNEIWCDVMAKHARDASQHWNRQDVDQCYADHQHHCMSTPLRRTDVYTGAHMACLPVYLSACVCACAFWWSPQKGLSKRLQIPEDSSPLERRKEHCWGLQERVGKLEETVKPPAMFTLLRERSSVLVGTAYSCTHTFHPALQIYGHTHTHTSSLMLHCRTASKWNVCASIMDAREHVCYCI